MLMDCFCQINCDIIPFCTLYCHAALYGRTQAKIAHTITVERVSELKKKIQTAEIIPTGNLKRHKKTNKKNRKTTSRNELNNNKVCTLLFEFTASFGHNEILVE